MLRFVAALALLSSAAVAQTGTGSIQGTVTDATSNKPITGAFVTTIRSGLPPVSQTTKSTTNGVFQLQNLPAGTYSLCVQIAGDGYLNPCDWGNNAPTVAGANSALTVTLAAGQTSSGNLLKVQPGSVVQVRLQDTGQFLTQKTSAGYNPDLALGVFGPKGVFYPAHTAVKDSSGATFQLTIPLNTAVTLHISSKALKLGTASATALPGNASEQVFQHNTGDATPTSFVFSVLGLNP